MSAKKDNICLSEDEIWDEILQTCVKWITCSDNEYFDNGKCLCLDGFKFEFGVCVIDHGCSRNETWNECSSPCEEVCGTEKSDSCIELCKPTCECNDGFIRYPDGNCVKVSECKLCPGDNIWDDDYRLCRKECSDNEAYNGKQCECADGFIEFNGICITEIKCGKFEFFNGCGSKCEPVCGQNQSGICTTVCGEPTCDCIDGYIRHPDGHCIPESECIVCGGDHEYLDDDNLECKCESGFDRDHQSGQCREVPRCSENEILNEWTCICRDGYINDNDICVVKCGRHEELTDGKCVCIEGYFLNRFGFCQQLPEDETCPEKEEWNGCSSPCEPVCGIAIPDNCPEVCLSKCDCIKGYIRSKEGICVKQEECITDIPECGLHEELFNDNSGCVCEDGYFRNDFGVCQIISTEPEKCKGVNEIINHHGECKCKKGYKRNKYGICCLVCHSCCDSCDSSGVTNNISNINFAPQNHNDQNFININTEIEQEVDMNVDFDLDALFDDLFDDLF